MQWPAWVAGVRTRVLPCGRTGALRLLTKSNRVAKVRTRPRVRTRESPQALKLSRDPPGCGDPTGDHQNLTETFDHLRSFPA
eukprot:4671829-Prymnesium_polylepis.1